MDRQHAGASQAARQPAAGDPADDTTAPILTHVRLNKKKLKRRQRSALSSDVSEAAAVTVTVFKRNRRVATIPCRRRPAP
jgi:hypothetical protein